MLYTPSTSHVSFDSVYEPAEDSFLLLDTLSTPIEIEFLRERFTGNSGDSYGVGPPFLLEVGTGSGIVLAFLTAHAQSIFNRTDLITLGTDVNRLACDATVQTVGVAQRQGDLQAGSAVFLDAINADLVGPIRNGLVDILIFNPPYVPTESLPDRNLHDKFNADSIEPSKGSAKFARDSYLLSLSYAGGTDGMETTNQLLEAIPDILNPHRGVAYILLCAQNKPNQVKKAIASWGPEWKIDTVGFSGKTAGWEKLQIIRIWRVGDPR